MEIERVCVKCGEINTLDSNNIRQIETKADGEYYKLMYYKCKRCGETIVLQIDNIETINICKDLKALLMKVMKKRMNHQTIGKKDNRKKDKLNKLLDAKRKELNDLCNGKTFYDLDGKIFIKQLTLPKVGDIIESDL